MNKKIQERYQYISTAFYTVINKCQDLDHPSYGKVNVTGYAPGYKAHYKCDYGYELVGEAYRECLYNGKWSGKEPVCERKIK